MTTGPARTGGPADLGRLERQEDPLNLLALAAPTRTVR